jgi:hypothetical protein
MFCCGLLELLDPEEEAKIFFLNLGIYTPVRNDVTSQNTWIFINTSVRAWYVIFRKVFADAAKSGAYFRVFHCNFQVAEHET